MNKKATCKTCGTTGPPWNHKPTVLATDHGVSQTEPPIDLKEKIRFQVQAAYDNAQDGVNRTITVEGKTNMIMSWIEAHQAQAIIEKLQQVYDFPKNRYRTDAYDMQAFVLKLIGELKANNTGDINEAIDEAYDNVGNREES